MKTVSPSPSLFNRFRAAGEQAPTPLLLWAGLTAIVLTTVLCFFAVFLGVRGLREGMQIVGKDSAPSIIAAQQIKSDLAAMHVQSARLLLGDANAAKAFEDRRLGATQGLLDAAMNITYGDAEKAPIKALLNGLGGYEQQIAQARILHELGDASFLDKHRQADEMMRATLLPAADKLDKANFDQLAGAYAQKRTSAVWASVWVVLTGVLLLGALAAIQYYLFRRMRRVLNPALAAATLATAFGLALTLGAFWEEASLLKRAKEDAFDSIHALMQARAEAEDANGDALRLLLDRSGGRDYGKSFKEKSEKLAKLPDGLSPQALQTAVDGGNLPTGFDGYLAAELRNITFDGEGASARESLKTYLHYLDVERAARRLADAEKQKEAVRMELGDKPDEAAGAFRRFDEALAKTLKINRDEFDKAVDQGFAALSGFDAASIVAALAVVLLAYLGLRPRLKEYAGS